jgi:hypothetical protein
MSGAILVSNFCVPTVLHQAAFINNIPIMQSCIGHQVVNSASTNIKQWVNAINEEGFSPIYISCYKGNLVPIFHYSKKLVRLLMKYGASLKIKSA